MAQLDRLKTIRSRENLAAALGYSLKSFTSIVYGIPQNKRYVEFSVPKAAGGERKILAPNPKLKEVQRRLARLLYLCVNDLEERFPKRKKVSHGFQKGRTIMTNAAIHRNRRYVLNLDLSNFFESIHFGRVRGFFLQDAAFLLPSEVAQTIAHIASHNGALPQGSPCSPVVSNLIGHILDLRMLKLAKRAKCTYSRYADDITFSTNAREFPSTIASKNETTPNIWSLSPELVSRIEGAGFKHNPVKTRMQIRGSRQAATGLVINEIVNVPREYQSTTRAMCHRLFLTCRFSLPGKVKPTENLAPLEGRLSFVHSVKRFNGRAVCIGGKTKNAKLSGIEKTYGQFLFYKYFAASTVPIVITEGVSDEIYIRAALRQRREVFPSLIDSATNSLSFKFLHLKANARSLLQMTSGVEGIGDLIRRYSAQLSKFQAITPAAPVILIVDNDQAAKKKVFGAASAFAPKKGGSKQAISIESDDQIYFLGNNLYLIKIPHNGDNSEKIIESLIPSDWLSKSLNGKQFDPNKKHGDHSTIGKAAFAKGIVQSNANKIDFSGFDPLLDMIAASLKDYQTKEKST